jgi:hypothetical protein
MKGIYLTEGAKQEIEAKMLRIENIFVDDENTECDKFLLKKEYNLYKEILSSATILPVEESWELADKKSDYGLSSKEFYPQGVIIQPKQ